MQFLCPEIKQRDGMECLNVLNDIYSLESVFPNARVNSLFGYLFQLIRRRDVRAEEEQLIKFWSEKLSKVCARAECELEKYWLNYFLNKSEFNWDHLAEFLYFKNYLQLVDWEVAEYEKFTGRRLQSCLLIGSGAMPLTALILAKKYGVKVDCLDIDWQVAKSSLEMIDRLGLSHLVSVRCGDFWLEKSLGIDKDLVLVGALIGADQEEKNLVLDKLKMSLIPGSNFLMRFGEGWASLAYLDFDKSKLGGFESFVILNPKGEIINSILIGKK